MNPLRGLAQFIAFLHNQSWTNKTSIAYQFLHFVLLIGLCISASYVYLNYFTGFILPINEKVAVVILVLFLPIVCTYVLLFGKKPYLRCTYNRNQVIFGGVVWTMLWVYLLPMFLLLI